MKKAIFFDIDETLTTTLSGQKFKQNPTDIKVMDGVEKGIDHFLYKYTPIGISNQGGVAVGHKSLDDAIAEMCHTLELLPQLAVIYICVDFEGQEVWQIDHDETIKIPNSAKTNCRKPEPGMLLMASAHYDIDLRVSWMIGDRSEDEQCAIAAGVNFIWADIFRNRFTGAHEVTNVTPQQLRFLELA